MSKIRPSVVWLTGAALAAACGGGSSGTGPINTMVASGGGGQSDTVLSNLPTALAVTIHDNSGGAVQGINVTWSAPSGGTVNGVTSTIVATDATGSSSVHMTLGPTAGTQTTTAAASGVTGSPVSFAETALPGNPFSLALSSQSGTQGTPNSTLTYSVIAKDKYANGVSGVSIAWAATFGGGGVNPASNSTGANGVASTQHQLGPANGHDTVTATSTPALSGSPVRIEAEIVTPPLTADVTVGPGNTIAFSPTSVTISASGTVKFTWDAANTASHGVNWLTGPTKPANSTTQTSGTYTSPALSAGTYTYDCTVHGASMSGTIIVVP